MRAWRHQLGLVLEDLVDDAAVDVELGRADLLDPLGDRLVERVGPARRQAERGGGRGARRPRSAAAAA